jgi:hypothetical protein
MNGMPHSSPAAKISFFVSRLEDASVLHYDAELAVELNIIQKSFHGRGQHLRVADLAAELHKAGIFSFDQVRHALPLSPLEKTLML